MKSVVIKVAGSSHGFVNGAGEVAKFSHPHGIVHNSNDDCLYICDSANHCIRRIDPFGEILLPLYVCI